MESAVEPRVPVAMRLPRREVEMVSAFAQEHGRTKTDAFLFYLRKGIDSEQESQQGDRLSGIETMLKEVLARLSPSSTLTRNDVLKAVASESQNFKAIKRAILFGSFARDEATETSDIDVRLELDQAAAFSLYDLARFQKAVSQRTGREVEAITADEIKNANLVDAIEREGLVVYERKSE